MGELLELTVAAAAAQIAAGEVSRRGVLRGLARGRRGRRAERVPVAGGSDGAGARGRWAGIPGRGQGPLLHRGGADDRRLAHPRGAPAALHGDRRAPAGRGRARRCSARPTWTSSRWAPRTRTPPTGRCSTRGTASRVPGGSSGGSAAAVAGGLAPCAIGTDTGGSIRQPAALCGIVGLKPTYGAISRYGMIAFASSLDQCGPLTRDVTDAALLLDVDAGPRSAATRPRSGSRAGSGRPAREDLKGLRFAVPAELAGDAIEPGVREVFEATLRRIEELGGEIAEVPLPHAEHGISAYYVIAPAEASSNLARYDGVRYGMRAEGDGDLIEMYESTRAAGLRRRGQAPDHARHLRALLRLLRRLLRPRAEGADEDRRGLRGGLRGGSTSSSRRPRPRSPSASARRPTTRWRCT